MELLKLLIKSVFVDNMIFAVFLPCCVKNRENKCGFGFGRDIRVGRHCACQLLD